MNPKQHTDGNNYESDLVELPCALKVEMNKMHYASGQSTAQTFHIQKNFGWTNSLAVIEIIRWQNK